MMEHASSDASNLGRLVRVTSPTPLPPRASLPVPPGLELQPVLALAAPIDRAEPLGHNAFAAEHAGVAEQDKWPCTDSAFAAGPS